MLGHRLRRWPNNNHRKGTASNFTGYKVQISSHFAPHDLALDPFRADPATNLPWETTQQIQNAEAMMISCWAGVADGGPTLNYQWFNISCIGWEYLPSVGKKLERRLRNSNPLNADPDYIRFFIFLSAH